jgi:hypothetical protein
MDSPQLKRTRFLAGIVMVALAAWMLVSPKEYYSMAGVMALGITGLISIASSRRG